MPLFALGAEQKLNNSLFRLVVYIDVIKIIGLQKFVEEMRFNVLIKQ